MGSSPTAPTNHHITRWALPGAFLVVAACFIVYQANVHDVANPFITAGLIAYLAVVVFLAVRASMRSVAIERLFALCYLMLGLLSFSAYLPCANIDGTQHYLRAFEVAQGEFVSHVSDDGTQLYATLPVGVIPDGYTFDGETYRDYGDVAAAADAVIDYSRTEEQPVYTQALYSPAAFAPSAFGIVLARLFTNGAWLTFYLSRLVNWLCVGLVLYFALKVLPAGKILAALVALLPINVQLATSNSPDGMMIALCLAFLALVLRCRCDSSARVTVATGSLLVLIALGVALGKIVYLPLVLLLFLLPKDKFPSQAVRWGFVVGVILCAAAADMLWSNRAFGLFIDFADGVDGSAQVAYVLGYPASFAAAIGATIAQQASDWFWGMVGPMLYLWSDDAPLFMADVFFYGYLVLIVCAFLLDDGCVQAHLSKGARGLLIAVTLIVDLLIFASLYVQWTPVGGGVVQGIQGRYFTPLLVPFLLAVKPQRVPLADGGSVPANLIAAALCIDGTLAAISLLAIL